MLSCYFVYIFLLGYVSSSTVEVANNTNSIISSNNESIPSNFSRWFKPIDLNNVAYLIFLLIIFILGFVLKRMCRETVQDTQKLLNDAESAIDFVAFTPKNQFFGRMNGEISNLLQKFKS
uniref:ATP synthase F0 subunit 8 n=1 Tax=Acrobeloides nanus TaxID=290746 RepID=A0A914CB06_9BILA